MEQASCESSHPQRTAARLTARSAMRTAVVGLVLATSGAPIDGSGQCRALLPTISLGISNRSCRRLHTPNSGSWRYENSFSTPSASNWHSQNPIQSSTPYTKFQRVLARAFPSHNTAASFGEARDRVSSGCCPCRDAVTGPAMERKGSWRSNEYREREQ